MKFTSFWLLCFALAATQLINNHQADPVALNGESQTARNITPDLYGPATQLAVLKDKSIKESSGIAASRNHPDIYWTHNDSGDGPFIYAFDIRGNRDRKSVV